MEEPCHAPTAFQNCIQNCLSKMMKTEASKNNVLNLVWRKKSKLAITYSPVFYNMTKATFSRDVLLAYPSFLLSIDVYLNAQLWFTMIELVWIPFLASTIKNMSYRNGSRTCKQVYDTLIYRGTKRMG